MDFFDLIVIDECHRGSAAADSAWREILEYFSSATDRTHSYPEGNQRSIQHRHFGEPIYTYSPAAGYRRRLSGTLKVVRIDLDRDLTGWRPDKGMVDKYGNQIEDRIYNQRILTKTSFWKKRTELVCQKISDFLKQTNRFDKTIVFCDNIDHAERMRQALVNEERRSRGTEQQVCDARYRRQRRGQSRGSTISSSLSPSTRYCHHLKADDNWVDAQTCKLIVLDQRIQSMTVKFKQIIGRGTLINEITTSTTSPSLISRATGCLPILISMATRYKSMSPRA